MIDCLRLPQQALAEALFGESGGDSGKPIGLGRTIHHSGSGSAAQFCAAGIAG